MRQLLTFGGVGLIATLVHYCMAVALFSVLGVNILSANIVAYLTAVGVSFFGHSLLTFQVGLTKGNFFRFLVISGLCFASAQGLLLLLEYVAIAPSEINMVFVVLFIPIISYIINKFWVYR